MVEIRFHGQSGQRAMASAELTAMAAIAQGKYARAFSTGPSDQSGTQETAYVRVSNRPIRSRKKAQPPDVVVVLDAALPREVDVTDGLRRNGLVIMNSPKSVGEIRKETGIKRRLGVADAGKSAVEIYDIPVGDNITLDTIIIASQASSAESLCRPSDFCLNPCADTSPAWQHAYKENHLSAL